MKTYHITESELQELKKIRNYFGEHDKTPFEHGAFDFLDNLINSATEEVVTKEDDASKGELINILLVNALRQLNDKERAALIASLFVRTENWEHIVSEINRTNEVGGRKLFVLSNNNNEGASLASHSCTIGNSIQQCEKVANDYAEWLELEKYRIKGMDDSSRKNLFFRFTQTKDSY